jgi:hypothetical protein
MKKTMIVLLALSVCFLAGNAFAAGGSLSSGSVTDLAGGTLHATTPAGADIGKMSTNVIVGATYSSTGYAIDTYHNSGTKAYGTAYDSTGIYWTDLGTGGTLTAPSSSAASEAYSGWTRM